LTRALAIDSLDGAVIDALTHAGDRRTIAAGIE
jgi:hypothetical protein